MYETRRWDSIVIRKAAIFVVQGLGLPLLGLIAVMRLLSFVVPPAMQTLGVEGGQEG